MNLREGSTRDITRMGGARTAQTLDCTGTRAFGTGGENSHFSNLGVAPPNFEIGLTGFGHM
jgi:hypothetical protein